MTIIKTLLIANRGEIACRIIKTCRRLNIKTIAIYAMPDVNASHVQSADVAHCIGEAALHDSYLNIDKIIAVAKLEKADAIHPGYGFLSENANFAERCQNENIIFVGPSADAIRAMAVKDQAKKIMEQADVPTVPGKLDLHSTKSIQEACQSIGLPVILKAACGGGGKGMRIVHDINTVEEAIRQAKKEALNAFGDDHLFVEKYLINARHIEIQIFRDRHGNCVHLFERDCSSQRRHQKIIEETPAIQISDSTKEKMYQAAIQAANAIDYTGAGTIEFLFSQDQQFYFMEMNTRLQVEHPVTEMTTGFDLVEWQIKVAQGESLPIKQSEVKQIGHAIEARIYAEDPFQQFLPQTGNIQHIFFKAFPNTRLDTGIKTGDHIGIYFDPLLCKLIAWGESREQAIHLLLMSLNDYQIIGVKNNISFLQTLLKSDSFKHGMDVQHLEQNVNDYLIPAEALSIHILSLAALATILHRKETSNNALVTPWDALNAFRITLPFQETLHLNYHNQRVSIKMQHTESQTDHVLLDISSDVVSNILQISGYLKGDCLYYLIDNSWHTVPCFMQDDNLYLLLRGHLYHFENITNAEQSHHSDLEDSNIISSPMPGLITKIWKKIGDSVLQGDKLFAVEAMKMEHTVAAPKAGKVKTIHFQLGEQVIEGAKLMEFQE